MAKLAVFNSVSLDGYFTGSNGDLSWAHRQADPEWDAFVESNASGGGRLLFGRVTYEMMNSFWPTEQAMKSYPVVAARMNEAQKIVFSRTLDKASWNNTRLMKGDMAAEVRTLKQEPGEGMVILGSGSVVSQLAPEGLIDEYQFVIVPVVLGTGRTMFDGMKEKLPLKLISSRAFANGNVFLRYGEL
jgi:dihydrofolate reductase